MAEKVVRLQKINSRGDDVTSLETTPQESDVHSHHGNGGPSPRTNWQLYAILAITALASALRFYNLGGFGFQGDENYTIASLLGPVIVEKNWPLLFLFNKVIVHIFGLSEFSIRLLPAIFGVCAIPLFYVVGKNAFSKDAMVVSCLFISLNQWHLFHSQNGRFYTSVFLFSGLALCWLVISLRTKNPMTAFLAAIAVCISTGFHPTGLWPAVAFGLYCVSGLIIPGIRVTLDRNTMFAFFLPLLVVGGVFAISLSQTSQYIAKGHGAAGWGYTPPHLVMGWVRGLELPILALGFCWMVGALLKDRPLGAFYCIAGLLPICCLTALALRLSIRPDYAFSMTPLWFMLAGAALAPLLSAKQVPPAARIGVVLAVCAALLPSTISHHTANLTCDPRMAFRFIKNHANEHDQFFHCFVPMLEYYTGFKNQHFGSDSPKTRAILHSIEASNRTSWFLVPSSREGVGNKYLANWLSRNASLEARFDAKRFDYEVRSILVYRCRPNQGKVDERPSAFRE